MPLLSALPLALGLVGPSLVRGHCSVGDFYSGLDWGLEPAELRSALHLRLRAPHTAVSPDLGARKAVEVLDADQHQPGQVILFDTQESVDSLTAWGPGHLWPKEKGVGLEGVDSVDLHCLRATGWNFSSALWTERPCERDGDAGCPPAPVRGDLARCLMYMALRYDGTEVDTERLRLTDCPGSEPGAVTGRRSKLIEWHLADPVDAAEQARNDRVCREYQGNRNPFVDRPALAQRLFPREPSCREGSPMAARRLQVATTGVVAATTVAPVVAAATTAGAVVTTVAPAATTVALAATTVAPAATTAASAVTAAGTTAAGTTAAPVVTAVATTAAAVVGTTGAAANVTTVLVTGLSTTATTSKTATKTASSSTATATTTRTSTTATRTTDTTSTVTNTSTATATTTKTTLTTSTTTYTTTTNSSTTTSTATTTKSTTTSSTSTASTSTASTSTASTSTATTMTSSTSSVTTTTPTTTTPTTTTPTTTTPTTTTPTTTTKTTSSSSTTTKTTMTSTKTTTSTVTTMTRTTVTTTRTETTVTRTRTITRSRYFAEMEVDLSFAQRRGGLSVLCLLSALLAATASAAAPH